MEPVQSSSSLAASKRVSWWRSLLLVAWSFLGVRSNREYQEDLAKVNPLHVMVVGLLAGFLLVLSLIVIVNWVVPQ